jgi:hypothetical protein
MVVMAARQMLALVLTGIIPYFLLTHQSVAVREHLHIQAPPNPLVMVGQVVVRPVIEITLVVLVLSAKVMMAAIPLEVVVVAEPLRLVLMDRIPQMAVLVHKIILIISITTMLGAAVGTPIIPAAALVVQEAVVVVVATVVLAQAVETRPRLVAPEVQPVKQTYPVVMPQQTQEVEGEVVRTTTPTTLVVMVVLAL